MALALWAGQSSCTPSPSVIAGGDERVSTPEAILHVAHSPGRTGEENPFYLSFGLGIQKLSLALLRRCWSCWATF